MSSICGGYFCVVFHVLRRLPLAFLFIFVQRSLLCVNDVFMRVNVSVVCFLCDVVLSLSLWLSTSCGCVNVVFMHLNVSASFIVCRLHVVVQTLPSCISMFR